MELAQEDVVQNAVVVQNVVVVQGVVQDEAQDVVQDVVWGQVLVYDQVVAVVQVVMQLVSVQDEGRVLVGDVEQEAQDSHQSLALAGESVAVPTSILAYSIGVF